jgi:outer membrane protein assembly factor BamB
MGVVSLVFLASCGGVSTPSTLSTSVAPSSSTQVTTSEASTSTTEPAASGGVEADWPTYHHDAARSGLSSDQGALGKAGRSWSSAELDGDVYAQPLVVGGKVIVATESDSVYALNAGSGAIVWQTNLGSPVPGSQLPCGNIDPSGITGTPVVDVQSNIVYVTAFLSGGPHHELYALDLATGKVRWHATVDPSGLAPQVEQQRGALALAGGNLYVAYGGLHGDCGAYKGALVALPADGSGTLSTYVVPTKRMSGIWNPAGPVVDGSGDLWVATGNSESQSSFDYGNAVIRLSPQLKVLDYFAPADWAQLNARDLDLGSLAPVLLPGGKVLTIGKDGTGYLLNGGSLGHVGGPAPTVNLGSSPFGSAVALGSRVFVPCTDSLTAVDVSASGLQVAWKVAGGAGSPIVAAGLVWYLGYDGQLRAVDPSAGAVDYSLRLSAPVTRFITPSAANGLLFVADGRKITAVSLR